MSQLVKEIMLEKINFLLEVCNSQGDLEWLREMSRRESWTPHEIANVYEMYARFKNRVEKERSN